MLVKARVDFKKPNIKAMKKRGNTLVDMHFHSKYSDGLNKVDRIVKRAKKLEIGIALTDHNTINGAKEAAKHKDLVLIPGVELTSSEGIHLLLYFYKLKDIVHFYNKYIVKNRHKNPLFCLNLGVNDLIDYAKGYNAIICAAHPFALFWTGLCKAYHKPTVSESTYKKVDAIEVITGSNMKSRNRMALIFAEKKKKAITGGTDGHTLHEMGRVLTYTKHPTTTDGFLDSIIKKENFVIGKETFIIRKAAAHSIKIRSPGKTPVSYIKKAAHYMNMRQKGKLRGLINNGF